MATIPTIRMKEEDKWDIPSGAELVIKSVVAEEILWKLLDQFHCSEKIDFSTVRRIISDYPNTCHRTYDFAWYENQTRQLSPLAVLCCLKAPADLIRLVFELNPQAITLPEPSTKAIPLDYACSYGASLAVVEFLFEKCPQAAQSARHEDLLPLHLACHFSAPTDVVVHLMHSYPEANQNCQSEGWFPLHAAAAGAANVKVCEELYKANPDSATAQDTGLCTPLHIACSNRADVSVINFLTRVAPETLMVEDVDSLTPLFRAVRNSTKDVVRNLLEHNPDLRLVDHLGGTILHHASGHGSAEMVEFLVSKFPEMITAQTRDRDGFTPLHVACLFGTSLEVVQTLIRHNPDIMHASDSHGRKPIHLTSDSIIYRYLRKKLERRSR